MVRILTPTVSVYPFRLTGEGPEYLVLHRREGLDHLGGMWQAVHGGIDDHETAVRAAWREVREEIGVAPQGFWQLDYVETHYLPGRDALRLVPCFAAQLPEDAPLTLGPEHEDHRWLPLDEVMSALMWHSQRQALRTLHETIALPLSEGRPVNPLFEIPPELYR